MTKAPRWTNRIHVDAPPIGTTLKDGKESGSMQFIRLLSDLRFHEDVACCTFKKSCGWASGAGRLASIPLRS